MGLRGEHERLRQIPRPKGVSKGKYATSKRRGGSEESG